MHRSREAGRFHMDNHSSRPGDCGRYPRLRMNYDVQLASASLTHRLNEVRSSIQGFSFLSDVVAWVSRQPGSCEIVHTVIQDEFTHDIVVRWTRGLYLVFDVT